MPQVQPQTGVPSSAGSSWDRLYGPGVPTAEATWSDVSMPHASAGRAAGTGAGALVEGRLAGGALVAAEAAVEGTLAVALSTALGVPVAAVLGAGAPAPGGVVAGEDEHPATTTAAASAAVADTHHRAPRADVTGILDSSICSNRPDGGRGAPEATPATLLSRSRPGRDFDDM
ncbi:hypothetical protein GCM10009665_17450 [Kitasatospora nipponensis]|uniref:Uncharacterized protein n=1 Tax=Kitasatospora nipponensis TaxID=258049 RepID=A0ABP4GL58_9ACTN